MADNNGAKTEEDSLVMLTRAFLDPVGNQLPLMSDVAINLPEPMASVKMINALAELLKTRIKENVKLAKIIKAGGDPKKFKRKDLPVLSEVWTEAYLHYRKGVHGEGRTASVDLIKEHLATKPIEEGEKGYDFGRPQ